MEERRQYDQKTIIQALQMLDSGEYTIGEVSESLSVPQSAISSWRGAIRKHAEVEINFKHAYKAKLYNWHEIAEAVLSQRQKQKGGDAAQL